MRRSRLVAMAGAMVEIAAALLVCSCLAQRTVGATSMGSPKTLRHVPSEFLTIQAALDASASGDTVLVAPGTYAGSGNVNLSFHGKDLVLVSEGGATATVIDGQGAYVQGIAFSDEEDRGAVIRGFTIRRADLGVYCSSGSPTIAACRVTESASSAVLCDGATSPLIEDCDLMNNRVELGGAALMIDGSGTVELDRCRVIGNEGQWPVVMTNPGSAANLILRECALTGNTDGGALQADGNQVTLENCLVAYNSEGGVWLGACTATITGCTITRNLSYSLGGGIRMGSTQLHLERTIISGNCGSQASDLYVGNGGQATLSCCQFNHSGILAQGGGTIDSIGPQVHGDPEFCSPRTCEFLPAPDTTSAGDYRLRSDSPCLPQFSPCGQQIGAFGMGCSAPEPVGACCLADHSCLVVTREQCQGLQGIYEGDNSGCYPNPCLATAIEETTWGRIKSRFGQ